ncbi:MAG: SH3 domain-containing protein [Candidatus Omnitrophica bacterium]|nr:SH3 domain-containing protein [Candidatus Omnitrophota bacterium]
MRWVCLFLTALIAFTEPAFAQARSSSASVPAAKGFPFTAETVSDRVNVRAGQNNNFESVAVLPKDTMLTVLDKKFKWYKVYLPVGAKAYVKSSYVKLLTADLGEVAVDRLNVRCEPNAEATTVGQLKQGQKFFIQKNEGEWIWIKPADGVYGWVNEALLVYKMEGARGNTEPDPNTVAAVKASEARAEQIKLTAKTALLIKSADGSVECAGKLQKVEGAPAAYKILHDNASVCFVDGPDAVLSSFVGSNVRVAGKIKTVPADADAAVVTLSKISLAL